MLSPTLSLPWLPGRRRAPDAIVLRARAGDSSALDGLVFVYRDRIVNLYFQILRDRDGAEDVAQETFLRAFAQLSQFRAEADFGTWLYRVAVTQCLQRRKSLETRRRLAPVVDLTGEAMAEVGAPGDFREASEARWQLDAVMDALPEAQRMVLVLREWHSLSYEEIAVVLAIPVGTVRSRLHKARHQFRLRWEAMQP